MTVQNCILWGSSGHAKVLVELLQRQNFRVVGLIDRDVHSRSVVDGVDIFTGATAFDDFIRTWDNSALSGFACIGGDRGRDRLTCLKKFKSHGISCPTIVSERAVVSASAKIAEGCQILAGAVIGPDVSLGVGCIVNHGSVVDHESHLGEGVHIAPGATITGCVNVEAYAFIGAGAVIVPRVTIGEGATVGAGATVVSSVRVGEKVAGTPARPLKKRGVE